MVNYGETLSHPYWTHAKSIWSARSILTRRQQRADVGDTTDPRKITTINRRFSDLKDSGVLVKDIESGSWLPEPNAAIFDNRALLKIVRLTRLAQLDALPGDYELLERDDADDKHGIPFKAMCEEPLYEGPGIQLELNLQPTRRNWLDPTCREYFSAETYYALPSSSGSQWVARASDSLNDTRPNLLLPQEQVDIPISERNGNTYVDTRIAAAALLYLASDYPAAI